MTMDFANKKLKIGGSPWQPATLGRQGEYLWPLTFEHDLIEYDPSKPQFELKTNDPDVLASTSPTLSRKSTISKSMMDM